MLARLNLEEAMKKVLFVFLLLLVLPVLYVYWYYFNVYSDGDREGVMMKISRKGDIFKTYEGEIMQPGFRTGGGSINSNNFKFTAIDEVVSKKLSDATGKTVKVHYVQYRRSLPWRGENYNADNAETGQYVVDSVLEVSATPAAAQTQLPPMMLPAPAVIPSK
jgi:hypothetical protein